MSWRVAAEITELRRSFKESQSIKETGDAEQ